MLIKGRSFSRRQTGLEEAHSTLNTIKNDFTLLQEVRSWQSRRRNDIMRCWNMSPTFINSLSHGSLELCMLFTVPELAGMEQQTPSKNMLQCTEQLRLEGNVQSWHEKMWKIVQWKPAVSWTWLPASLIASASCSLCSRGNTFHRSLSP